MDQPRCRDAAAPAAWCRAACRRGWLPGPLQRCSWLGTPMSSADDGWRTPQRALSAYTTPTPGCTSVPCKPQGAPIRVSAVARDGGGGPSADGGRAPRTAPLRMRAVGDGLAMTSSSRVRGTMAMELRVLPPTESRAGPAAHLELVALFPPRFRLPLRSLLLGLAPLRLRSPSPRGGRLSIARRKR
jgi:hypothetical protein